VKVIPVSKKIKDVSYKKKEAKVSLGKKGGVRIVIKIKGRSYPTQ